MTSRHQSFISNGRPVGPSVHSRRRILGPCPGLDERLARWAGTAAGNKTKVPKPASWSAHYDLTWDAWNRLVKVADGANTVAEYQYDGQNRRIVKKLYSGGSLDETRHIYLSTENQVLEERVDSSTSADRQFTWGDRYVDDLVMRTRDTDGNGSLDETLYALQDANWNVTALTDTSGTVVERFVYDAYGGSTVLDADFTADGDGLSDYDWEYRFTSREYDSETGLHYFRARYYHDGIGRFIGRDPLGFVDGGNLYAGYFVPGGLDPSGTGELEDLEKLWKELGEKLKKTTDLKERKAIQKQREEIRRKIKILKEYAKRIREKLRNNEGRGGGGRRGGGKSGGRSGKTKCGFIKWMFVAECETACAVWYDGCLERSQNSLVFCLGGARNEEAIELCERIAYLDMAECGIKYTACGLGCLLPLGDFTPQ